MQSVHIILVEIECSKRRLHGFEVGFIVDAFGAICATLSDEMVRGWITFQVQFRQFQVTRALNQLPKKNTLKPIQVIFVTSLPDRTNENFALLFADTQLETKSKPMIIMFPYEGILSYFFQ